MLTSSDCVSPPSSPPPEFSSRLAGVGALFSKSYLLPVHFSCGSASRSLAFVYHPPSGIRLCCFPFHFPARPHPGSEEVRIEAACCHPLLSESEPRTSRAPPVCNNYWCSSFAGDRGARRPILRSLPLFSDTLEKRHVPFDGRHK